MDEPDSGIDVEALERIFEALRALRERQVTVIMITHSLSVLQQAEHAFLLCDGQLVDKGSIEKIGRYFEQRCLDCTVQDPAAYAGEGDESSATARVSSTGGENQS
jgi:Fe-S cluster assembly ATP-binding protein